MTTQVTTEQVAEILGSPRRKQGPLIDAALERLMQNGRNHKEAFAELGELLGVSPSTIGQGFYRRKRQKGEGRPLVRVRSDMVGAPTPEVARAVTTRRRNGGLQSLDEARDAMMLAITAYADAVAAERLAEVRRALG